MLTRLQIRTSCPIQWVTRLQSRRGFIRRANLLQTGPHRERTRRHPWLSSAPNLVLVFGPSHTCHGHWNDFRAEANSTKHFIRFGSILYDDSHLSGTRITEDADNTKDNLLHLFPYLFLCCCTFQRNDCI